jgi:hypothetical protein
MFSSPIDGGEGMLGGMTALADIAPLPPVDVVPAMRAGALLRRHSVSGFRP